MREGAGLMEHLSQGNISRQEAVSMIPPLLLGVEPRHFVLDMCAAPGSKTSQLIESLHYQDTLESSIPSGIVIANDADNSRCYTLVHQAKRLNSPCLIITNNDATQFPVLYYNNVDGKRVPLQYDRVLCDVPCSGDGTMRKNPTIWRSWNPNTPLSLHRLQLRLLMRGLELLKPGGRLVYSTCSMNPIEDEAVIAGALKLCNGSVELVDTSSLLPGLKRTNGVNTWKVLTKNGEWISSYKETPSNLLHTVHSSMFPPTALEADTYQLNRWYFIL
ncbi:PREDICTED: tRNA (cytosine(34)-C(5))-methyltransferase-like, partial [Amphimedon queenslandica]|uniref:SAM-dependent MTase RsmB/NOP-type domain-containing protein n=1 Tax=Amphimedon queenslandica TaxID=400682 RepID=A0AAN0II86_AMPQE